jgi:hypothetical protein
VITTASWTRNLSDIDSVVAHLKKSTGHNQVRQVCVGAETVGELYSAAVNSQALYCDPILLLLNCTKRLGLGCMHQLQCLCRAATAVEFEESSTGLLMEPRLLEG